MPFQKMHELGGSSIAFSSIYILLQSYMCIMRLNLILLSTQKNKGLSKLDRIVDVRMKMRENIDLASSQEVIL